MEENDNIMEEDNDLMEEEEEDNIMEEDDNTGGGLSLYQLSASAIVCNFSTLRDGILQCPDKILLDVFYQVFIIQKYYHYKELQKICHFCFKWF